MTIEDGRVPKTAPGSRPTDGAAEEASPPVGFDPSRVILRIAQAAEAFAFQAGVGGMETAGSIVSYLAKHPDQIDGFLSGEASMIDWPFGWHTQGCLTWHAMNGTICSPEKARRSAIIRKMEKGR